ncbi:TerD family protein [Streptomyces pacificus]|uniref:TerD family protein n=1 Tax=Streptomyces pacificus TaxID=2705029 RepID=A0A6A0AQJ3_9ACTN|nr:TerD family protein [Streptomyces pacificus]GFH35226.1 TerD family protein [Streptomyces pacificus]
MTAELVRGQNHPVPHTRLDIRVSAGEPVVVAVALSDEHGRVPGAEWVAHPARPALPGVEVSRQATAGHLLAVDLTAVPSSAHRAAVLLALPTGPGCPGRFGALAAPFVSLGAPDAPGTVSYTVTGLDSEAAVVALEFYRRQGAWKVRAVGQGYAGGLAACLADQGLDRAGELAAAVGEAVAHGLARPAGADPARTAEALRAATAEGPGPAADPGPAASPTPGTNPRTADPAAPPPARTHGGPVDYTHPRRRPAVQQPPPVAPPGRPPVPVAGDATGWSVEERLYNQVWGMFEDLARTTAAYRSAVDFAASRLGREHDRVLSDPHGRVAGPGDGAREAARTRHDELTGRAREALDRDLDQLTAESRAVEPALPPAFARWDSPVWGRYRVPAKAPMALRLGDLHLPERPGLRIPMLMRLPLERGLWVDSGLGPSQSGVLPEEVPPRTLAMDTAVAHAARLIAVHPAGEFTVRVIDAAGTAARSLNPLLRSGMLDEPPAAGAAGVSAVLAKLVRRVDLVQMAVRGGAADALPPDLDTARELLIVSDFPRGFDDRAVTRLRYLADEGPEVGVHLLMVADREDASGYGPVLDPFWHSLLRITPVPDDHLADPWVRHVWTYLPPALPEYRDVLGPVLAKAAEARRARRR